MLIPGSTGTKRGTDSFWLRHTGTLRFPSSSCSPGRGSFPVPCARLQTEAVRVTATGGADFPSSSTLSALLCKSVEGGSNFSKAQAKWSRFPPLGHSASTPRQKWVWERTKEKKAGSLGLPGSSKVPGYQLGSGKVHKLALISEWHPPAWTEASSFSTSIACNGDSTEYPVLKQEDRQQSLSFKVLGRSRLLSFIPAANEGNLSTSATSSPNLWAGKYLCLLQSHLPTEEFKSVEQLPKTAK